MSMNQFITFLYQSRHPAVCVCNLCSVAEDSNDALLFSPEGRGGGDENKRGGKHCASAATIPPPNYKLKNIH